MKNEEYIKKWVDSTLTDEERKFFENSDDYKFIKRLSEAIQLFRAPEYAVESELKRLINITSTEAKVVRFSWVKPLLPIAAVIILVSTLAFIFWDKSSENDVETFFSEKKEVILPDESRVLLNAKSFLSYTQKKWGESQKVLLKGEAYFKVAKGSKFEVVTSHGTVSVLGTQFNVKNRQGYFEVTCYEGWVEVQCQGKIEKLGPNSVFRLLNGEFVNANTSVKMPSWVKNESLFESVPLRFVINELERQYAVTIFASNLDLNQRFTGGFVHRNLPLALKSICLPLNLDYRIDEDQKIILIAKTQ